MIELGIITFAEIELIAVVSQLFYFGRWWFQIRASKRAGRSVNPKIFWVLTIFAQSLLMIYTFMLGSMVLPFSIFAGLILSIYLAKKNIGYEGNRKLNGDD